MIRSEGKMRGVLVVVALACATAVMAVEGLTVGEVIAAHRAGAPVEGILRLVREAPDVAVLAARDLDRLKAAGVPDVVIQAIVARHAPATPTPTPAESKPDDARLEDVVRLVRAGLSERLVCEQIRQSGRHDRPTANDLVYLKDHGVPETVIAAVMESGAIPTPTAVPASPPTALSMATPTPLPTAAPVVALVFEPLVRLTGTFRKAQAGRLVLTGESLEWSDATDAARVERTASASLKAVWLATARPSQGPLLVELRVRTSTGEDLTFRDVDWSAGGSARIGALYHAIRERFPEAMLPEKPVR
jgi:hypothetical protein